MIALGDRDREAVRDLLAGLERDVDLRLELGPAAQPVTVIAAGEEIDFGEETRSLAEAVAAESSRVRLSVVEAGNGAGRFPRLTIGERLRYDGLPFGYELSSLVYGILEAGRAEPSLSTESLAALADVDRDVEIEVFVTPT